jgi:hypothetical protein
MFEDMVRQIAFQGVECTPRASGSALGFAVRAAQRRKDSTGANGRGFRLPASGGGGAEIACPGKETAGLDAAMGRA